MQDSGINFTTEATESTYTGCHKYVPFARFANRRKCNVQRPEVIINMTTAILLFFDYGQWHMAQT